MLKSLDKKKPLKIDAHAHVFLKSLPMLENTRYTPDYDATPEAYFELLKSQNLDGCLLIQPSFLGTDNSYLLDVIESATTNQPSLLVKGVAVVDHSLSLEELTILKQSGITGVRFNCIGKSLPDLKNDFMKQFLLSVDSLGLHVEVHIEGNRLDSILEQLLRTNSRVVIDHFGLPEFESKLLTEPSFVKSLEQNDRELCVNISAPYRVYPQLSLKDSVIQCGKLSSKLCDVLGPKRLIWGSDWPWTQNHHGQNYSDTLNWAKEWISNHDYIAGHVPNWLLNPD